MKNYIMRRHLKKFPEFCTIYGFLFFWLTQTTLTFFPNCVRIAYESRLRSRFFVFFFQFSRDSMWEKLPRGATGFGKRIPSSDRPHNNVVLQYTSNSTWEEEGGGRYNARKSFSPLFLCCSKVYKLLGCVLWKGFLEGKNGLNSICHVEESLLAKWSNFGLLLHHSSDFLVWMHRLPPNWNNEFPLLRPFRLSFYNGSNGSCLEYPKK